MRWNLFISCLDDWDAGSAPIGWVSVSPSLSPFSKREADSWGMMGPKSPPPSSLWISLFLAGDLFEGKKSRDCRHRSMGMVLAATRKNTDNNQGKWEALVWRQPSWEELSTQENLGSDPETLGLPMWRSGKEPSCQCRRHGRLGFDPWVGKIPWSRKWQPTPVF